MLNKHILEKTHFIPMEHMRKVIEVIRGTNPYKIKKRVCDNNLYILQRTRLNTFDYSIFGKANWVMMFSLACHKALYSQDWDKLHYLLKKVPRWKFTRNASIHFDIVYIRYVTLLLMYHPSSQAQGLLCDYFHMTLGCRSDQDKKAILKILLHLPKKLPHPVWNKKKNNEDSD